MQMGEINRRYFDGLMADQNLSLRGLAAKLGMGHSQLSLTFNGARKLQLDEAAKLSSIFGVPLHEIVENAGVSVRPGSGRRVNVAGALRGDGTVEVYGPDVVEMASTPGDLPDDAVAIQARTSGSPLDWLDRTVFFCRKPDGVAPTAVGSLCWVKVKDGPSAIAAVKRGYAEGTFNLSGLYSRENATLEWASPILLSRP